VANDENFHDKGYANELSIATRLEAYIRTCLNSLEPLASVKCSITNGRPGSVIHCSIEIDESQFSAVDKLIDSELRILERQDNAIETQLCLTAVVPAIVKSESDTSNQVFSLTVSRGRGLPVTSKPTILALPNRGNVDPNYGLSKTEIEHVIVLIHGIRDVGAWHAKVSDQLVQRGTKVVQIRYGYYPAIRFLFPLNLSKGPVTKVLKRLRALRFEFPNAKLSVIAHSFGTYVFLKTLEVDSDLEYWKVVFCGSVANDEFEWSELKRRVGDRTRATQDFILNDCGTGDALPILGTAFGWHYGMAGATGFSEGFVTNRFHKAVGGSSGGHSLYFDPQFVVQKWKPFLINDEAPERGDGAQGEHLCWCIRLLYHGWIRIVCKLFALLIWLSLGFMVLLAIYIGYGFFAVVRE
jgi:hypothetical protein